MVAAAGVSGLFTAAACVAAAALLAACGDSGQAVRLSATTTTAQASATGTGASTGTVAIDDLIGPQGIDYEANPALASALPSSGGSSGSGGSSDSGATGDTIDGVQCQTLPQLAYQANAHLQVYVDGRPRALPGGIGLVKPSLHQTSGGPMFAATTCYYWLHTLTQDGVIEVASPVDRRFELGQLFAIWGEPLSRGRVASAVGRVTAIVNGRRWRASPTEIPLREHETIELAIGRPVPAFVAVDWSTSDL